MPSRRKTRTHTGGVPEVSSANRWLDHGGIGLIFFGFIFALAVAVVKLLELLDEAFVILLGICASALGVWGAHSLYRSGNLYQEQQAKRRHLDKLTSEPLSVSRQLSLRPYYARLHSPTAGEKRHQAQTQVSRVPLPIHETSSYVQDSLAEAVRSPPHDALVIRGSAERGPMQEIFDGHTARDPHWSTLNSRDFAIALTIVEEAWYVANKPEAIAEHQRQFQELLDRAFRNRETGTGNELEHTDEIEIMNSALDDTRAQWPDDAVVHRDELESTYSLLRSADPTLGHTPDWATAAIHVELTNLQRIGAGQRQGLPAGRIASEQRLAWARLSRAIHEAVRAGDEITVAEPPIQNIHFDPTGQHDKS